MTDSVTITLIDRDGEAREVEARLGHSLMESAKVCEVLGIDGDCGGNAVCGTCQIAVQNGSAVKLPPMKNEEKDMLDFLERADPKIRLSCQITVTEALAGLTARVATDD